jgi:hydrogenase maturation protease
MKPRTEVTPVPGAGQDPAARKPRLVLGLGNELAGDDAIGLWVADRLRGHPRLPADVEVRLAGSDLLRAQNAIRGRERVVLVDAILGETPSDGLGDERPGAVIRLDLDDLADHGASVHQLPPTAALELLRATDPAVREVPVELVGIVIERADMRNGLSPAFAARLGEVTERVLALLH